MKNLVLKLVYPVVRLLMKWCEYRGRKYYILGRAKTGGQLDQIYLVRWQVFKTRFGSCYIHRFMRSDADVPHCHPWNFYTYMLEGAYTETKLRHIRQDQYVTELYHREAGSLARRLATDIHKVGVEKGNEPLTICFIGRKRKDWGFWQPCLNLGLTKQYQFIPWQDFLNTETSQVPAAEYERANNLSVS